MNTFTFWFFNVRWKILQRIEPTRHTQDGWFEISMKFCCVEQEVIYERKAILKVMIYGWIYDKINLITLQSEAMFWKIFAKWSGPLFFIFSVLKNWMLLFLILLHEWLNSDAPQYFYIKKNKSQSHTPDERR